MIIFPFLFWPVATKTFLGVVIDRFEACIPKGGVLEQ